MESNISIRFCSINREKMLKNYLNDISNNFGGKKFKILRFMEIRLFHISLIRHISRGDHFGYSGN